MAAIGSDHWRYGHRAVITAGLISWIVTAAQEVLTALHLKSFRTGDVTIRGLIQGAIVATTCTLLFLGVLSVLALWKNRKWMVLLHRRIATISVAIILSMASLALTLVFLVMIKIDYHAIGVTSAGRQSQTAANFVMSGLAAVAQCVFYFCVLSHSRDTSHRLSSVLSQAPRDSVISETKSTGPYLTLQTLSSLVSKEITVPSPTLSTASSTISNTLKASVQQIVRPVTSRTKLLGRPDSAKDTRSICSDSHSMSTISQTDGFDSWDTSNVDANVRDALMSNAAPSRGTVLEPIPGSRPVSPARALDGPFLEHHLEQHLANMSTTSLTPPRPQFQGSRPPSPALSEAHIHPLFRTDSPIPPPAVVTPGTVVTAAPLGGQTIAYPGRPFSRARSYSSRTASPGPGSSRVNQEPFMDRNFNSSSTTIPRAITPPIPDFILAATPRNSLGGYGKRKVSLQTDSE